jgi:hypothetical protein
MKSGICTKIMAIAFVAGFSAQVKGMEPEKQIVINVVATIRNKWLHEPSKPVLVGNKALLGKNDESKMKTILGRQFPKSGTFYPVYLAEYKWGNTTKSFFAQGNWILTLPGFLSTNDKDSYLFPHYLDKDFALLLLKTPYEHQMTNNITVEVSLDDASKKMLAGERLKSEDFGESELEELDEKKSSSWLSMVKSAMPSIVVLSLIGAGLWAYKNQPTMLSNFYAKFNQTILAPLSKYFKGQ